MSVDPLCLKIDIRFQEKCSVTRFFHELVYNFLTTLKLFYLLLMLILTTFVKKHSTCLSKFV